MLSTSSVVNNLHATITAPRETRADMIGTVSAQLHTKRDNGTPLFSASDKEALREIFEADNLADYQVSRLVYANKIVTAYIYLTLKNAY